MPKKRILFIYNPISGGLGKKIIINQIEAKLDKTKYDHSIRKTEYAGHATVLTREAVDEGVDVVCAVGGDGTMNEVARALIGTRSALAIIPCGSGNGLARHLHIPLDPIRAIELINEGDVSPMDYGVIDLHPFFCTCGVGFDAFISQQFAKSKFRGPLAYIENVLKNGLKYNPQTYNIEVVNEREEHTIQKAFLISCGNASQYGNNLYIAPQASVRDGLLDVTIIKPFTVLEVPQIALHLLHGSVSDSNLFSTFRCKSLTIHRATPGVIHYDGDPVESGNEVEVAIVPHGLLCICPKKEGVFDVAENIQNVIAEQLGLFQMHGEELINRNKQKGKTLLEHLKAKAKLKK